MTTHKIDAQRSGNHPTMGDWDADYVITFTCRPGAPDTFDEPGYGPEIDFVSISPGAGDHGAFTDLAQKDLEEWAADWLDEHLDECCAIAEADDARAADEAADMKREDQP
jgi:hypothetical protein